VDSDVDSYDVLVVDDDPYIRATVADILQDAGYVVVAAENALEAAHTIARTPPKVVLLDIRMPGLDGPQLARDIRARNVQSKILVMTAGRNAQRYARELEADGYIEKPFEIDDLRAAVERLVPPGGLGGDSL
jgi:DNA-binding response OmpR family regulator